MSSSREGSGSSEDDLMTIPSDLTIPSDMESFPEDTEGEAEEEEDVEVNVNVDVDVGSELRKSQDITEEGTLTNNNNNNNNAKKSSKRGLGLGLRTLLQNGVDRPPLDTSSGPVCDTKPFPHAPVEKQKQDLLEVQAEVPLINSAEYNAKKAAHVKQVLENRQEIERDEVVTKVVNQWNCQRAHNKENPETTLSLDFLTNNQEYRVPGPNPMRIPHDDLQNALNGFNNMFLAHEIAIDHDFKLQAYAPEAGSVEEVVKRQMRKAYWDLFDEFTQMGTEKYVPSYMINTMREMKKMLLALLLPHNTQIRGRIEQTLTDENLIYEVEHEIFEFDKYKQFFIETLSAVCCPARDVEIRAIEQLTKPSEVLKGLINVMEEMKLDMANFLISQIRPTIISTCVTYERKKFAKLIETEYLLREDPLRTTRSWILRHSINNREPEVALSRAYVELLSSWKDPGQWPETLTVDWKRFMELAEETKRVLSLGAVIHSVMNAITSIITSETNATHLVTASQVLPKVLGKEFNILLTKKDCATPESMENVMNLLAEQSIKICDMFMLGNAKRNISEDEKNLVRGSVKGCARDDNTIRNLLHRRLEDFGANIYLRKRFNVDVPKALIHVETLTRTIIVEWYRIVSHNLAVFMDLYLAIIDGELKPPTFMEGKNSPWDPSIVKIMQQLTAPPKETLGARQT